MRMIRDMDGDEISDQTVVTFGRYQGFVFEDVPTSYTDWAIREMETSDNADPQLTQMANWAAARKEEKAHTNQTGKQPRDMDGDEISDQTVVTFGRYQGCAFKDVPTSYTDWAIREAETSDNTDPQLTQMANWAAARKAGKAHTSQTGKQPLDPEVAAKIKPPPMDVECVPVAPPKPTARAAKKPATSTNSSSAASTASFEVVHQVGTKGRRNQNPSDSSMPSPEALSEVQLLEQQLALARQKHGMTAAHHPEANGAGGGPSAKTRTKGLAE